MENKTARLTVLIDPEKKRAFEDWCRGHDVTPSQVVRKLIRDYLIDQGVKWTPGGLGDSPTTSAPLD
jgi:Ribbon-helix-helix protein